VGPSANKREAETLACLTRERVVGLERHSSYASMCQHVS